MIKIIVIIKINNHKMNLITIQGIIKVVDTKRINNQIILDSNNNKCSMTIMVIEYRQKLLKKIYILIKF